MTLAVFVFIQYRLRQTDRQPDSQTDTMRRLLPANAMRRAGKKLRKLINSSQKYCSNKMLRFYRTARCSIRLCSLSLFGELAALCAHTYTSAVFFNLVDSTMVLHAFETWHVGYLLCLVEGEVRKTTVVHSGRLFPQPSHNTIFLPARRHA